MKIKKQTVVKTTYEISYSEVEKLILEICKKLRYDISITTYQFYYEEDGDLTLEVSVLYNKLSKQEAQPYHKNLAYSLEKKFNSMCKDAEVEVGTSYIGTKDVGSLFKLYICDYSGNVEFVD